MKTIVFSNNKGGVAKTITTATIGDILAQMGKRVLLIDLDGQGNLGMAFGIKPTNENTFAILSAGRMVQPTAIRNNLHIVPSCRDIAVIGTNNMSNSIRNLAHWLAIAAQNYDFCFVDTPPNLGVGTIAAFAVADGVIIPTAAEPFAYAGLNEITTLIQKIQSTMNSKCTLAGILITKYNNRKVTAAAAAALRKYFGEQVFTTIIHESIAVIESVSMCQTIATYMPNNRVAVDYFAAADELIKRTK